MKKKTLFFIIFFLIVFVSGAAIFFKKNKTVSVCIEGFCYKSKLAEDIFSISKGLMGIKDLPDDSGMLFDFKKEGIYPFWMKNTLIPLDIIWINSDNKIVFIKENAQPCAPDASSCPSINPNIKARYVLEISGGQIFEKNIKNGSEVKILK